MWNHTYQGLVRRFEHPVKFREVPQKPQTTTQIKSPQRIVIGSCFSKKKIIISKIAKIANNSNRENQFKNYSGKIVSLSRQRTQGISLLIQNGEICPMSCLLSPTSTCKQLMLMFVDSFFIYVWLRLENKWYGLH